MGNWCWGPGWAFHVQDFPVTTFFNGDRLVLAVELKDGKFVAGTALVLEYDPTGLIRALVEDAGRIPDIAEGRNRCLLKRAD